MTSLPSNTLYRIIAVLLILMTAILLFGHGMRTGVVLVECLAQILAGVMAGPAIGANSFLMSVAGGELLIQRLCSRTVAYVIVGYTRYSRD